MNHILENDEEIDEFLPQKTPTHEYSSPLRISGAIQKGLPTNVLRLLTVSVRDALAPKSASLTAPVEESNTLAAVQEVSERVHPTHTVTRTWSGGGRGDRNGEIRCNSETFDVAVDFVFAVQVSQTEQHFANNHGNARLV